ncbi:class I SAM-dependent methyltransferase [Aestuariibacter halophilus]|uniref:Class I SAM-dependent methyltransferase n=1 Tax=Fluctibacter halophilus TaxID=226011 RepID=A0ABS8G4K8_9ALTE|nr:class I SAM-dependent methyltransferase [Aestuariibacter halophilus]MCC2615527.1 class I SAM-dependent methyltransferase [Aestuariibacter halophilus]
MSSQIILQPKREKSLLRQHPWIFASALAPLKKRLRSGETVDVISSDGQWLARGAYSPQSQIQVRVWTFDKNEVIDNGFFLRRIQAANTLRKSALEQSGATGYRVVAAEADGLPGVTIDRYDNVLVCQLLSAGADKHRDKIVWALKKTFPDCVIYERSDVAVREKEGLPLLTQALHGEIPDSVQIEENGVSITVNVKEGHKTGFYLDQRDSRAAAARYAKGKTVLNCFSYTGTFSCYALKGGASHVTNIDVSDLALAIADKNHQLNGIDPEQYSLVKEDVFEALRRYQQDGKTFDMIVLDPPKFVDSKASLNRACRGYKDINRLAMGLLNPGGILLTFSCSGLMPTELFHKVVADAALDAKRTVHYLERLGQAPDHPVLSTYPEGYYLKGLVCHVA